MMDSQTDNEPFAGFEQPQQNYSKLPHAFIDLLPVMQSKAELCIVLYILRHTWGYQEYEDARRISVDEFANGRKRRNGTRIDNGIGMSEPAIRSGIKAAIGHGFIKVEVDDSDKARVEKFYKLNMAGENNLPPDSEEGGKQFTPNGKKSTPDHRKKPQERKLLKDSAPQNGATPPFTSKTSVNKAGRDTLQAYFRANESDMRMMFALNGKNMEFVPFDNESFTTRRGMVWQHVQVAAFLAGRGVPVADYLKWLGVHFGWRKNGVKVNEPEFSSALSVFITARQSGQAPHTPAHVAIQPAPDDEPLTPDELAERQALVRSVRPEWEVIHE